MPLFVVGVLAFAEKVRAAQVLAKFALDCKKQEREGSRPEKTYGVRIPLSDGIVHPNRRVASR